MSEACRYERELDLVLRSFMLLFSDSGLEMLCVLLSDIYRLLKAIALSMLFNRPVFF